MKKIFTLSFLFLTLVATAQPFTATISVNMANETTSPDGVFIAGGANFGNPGDNPMFDDGTNGDAVAGDDVWTIIIDTLSAGYTGNFTFTNGNCPDYSCKENIVGLPCADGPFSDRLLDNIQADYTLATCFSQCTTDGSCATLNPPVDVTFKVDMSNEVVAGPVFVTGGFDGWCGTCNPMDDSDGDNIYEVTITMDQGAQEYKYTNGGWDPPGGGEEFDPATTDSLCTLTSGTFTNRYLFIDTPDPIILDVNCFNECGECEGEPVLPTDVTFRVDMGDVAGTVGPVYISGGTIDGWCGTCTEMTDGDGDMIYDITLPLDPGPHEYKFVNIGWGTDEMLDEVEDAACTITTDGFTNRLVEVDTMAMTLDVVCYESCESCPTGIEEMAVAEFTMDPSSTNDQTLITFNEVGSEKTLRVFALSGVKIAEIFISGDRPQFVYDASALANGVYLVNIETQGVNITKKLVVSK